MTIIAKPPNLKIEKKRNFEDQIIETASKGYNILIRLLLPTIGFLMVQRSKIAQIALHAIIQISFESFT